MKAIFIIFLYSFVNFAHAFELDGVHDIVLSNSQGERIVIGEVLFTPLPEGRAEFRVTMSETLEEYFLAMRPFRCLTGPRQRLCHFPVAREPAIISRGDLAPLEYALMFMRTAPGALHVNAFNGVFYRLQVTGSAITGRLHELDMDPFITPDSVPVERRTRPVREQDLTPGDADGHWLPLLAIEAGNVK